MPTTDFRRRERKFVQMGTEVDRPAPVLDHSHDSIANLKPFDRQQELRMYKPPPFIPPYPVKQNPNYSKGRYSNWARKWLLNLKVDEIFSTKMFEMLNRMDIPYFANVLQPLCDEWGLQWSCKVYFMLWITDDLVDSTKIGKSASDVLSLFLDYHLVMMWTFPDDPVLHRELPNFLSVLASQTEREQKLAHFEEILVQARTRPGTIYEGNLSIACEVFRELFAEAYARSSRESVLQFAHCCQHWLLGDLLESQYREAKGMPASIEELIPIRKRACAVFVALASTDISCGLATPTEYYNSKPMKEMLDACCDFTAWHNDVWSFKKEIIQDKEPFSLVVAISVHRKLPYQEAAEVLTKMMSDRLKDMDRAATDLERITPPELARNFQIYVSACQTMASGTHDWHTKTVRYDV
nr:terpene synthase [Radula lindenbergiana]